MLSGYPRTKTLEINAMALYQGHFEQGALKENLEAYYTCLADEVVAACEKVIKLPPLAKPCDALELYRWATGMVGEDFAALMAGELAQLRAAEALDAAPQLGGDALLAAFYLNELVLRLAPRQDPLPELDAAYARTRERLRAGEPLAWTLRRFERDLLAALGVGFELDCDGDGEPLDPAARYRLDPEHGPSRLRSDRGHGERNAAATGSALLALGADRQPLAADLASLRLPLRVVLAHHLGSRGLKSWEMAASLGRWNRQG